MKAHFVTYYSPGMFMHEETTRAIDGWYIEAAMREAATITERYGAHPYGFRFSTRERGEDELDSKVTTRSGMYFLPHCELVTLEQAEAEDPGSILSINMRGNGIKKVARPTQGWKCSVPFNDGDTLLITLD